MKESAYINRRGFLKRTAGTVAVPLSAKVGKRPVIEIDDAASAPVRWAAGELARTLEVHGLADFRVKVEVTNSPAEAFALTPVRGGMRAAGDTRGLVYALLELADRAERGSDLQQAASEQPYNRVRSVQRLFSSDIEDKPWFNDREMWPQYLTMLAAQRFNRFNLSFGIGYDFLRQVTDAYCLFLYPFMLDVPGYKVRAANLPDSERDHNLEMLRFISEQTVARGLEFQLGIWMHGYEWINSPNPNYTIEGLNAGNHGAYCRDALAALLKACPAISGVTFRIHGESGVAEGSYPFWKTVFDGIGLSGRKVEIDMHAKGLDQGMIDVALATKMPVRVSPKYWAEHMGMPYHQADIREEEMPKGKTATGLMALSAGSRSFTRYGYADFLNEDRKYSVIHRIWPGTQRLLLWGDPVTAAGYSKAFRFCGSDGVEWMEPLSFKGRRGSGVAGGRCAYADASLAPKWDWQKYEYSYRVWGRALYNPESKVTLTPAEEALANASRILPIITTAHLPSAANNTYWPEIYTNHPMVDPKRKNPYGDTPAPKVFQNASPLDTQLFSRMSDHADELLKGDRSGRYSPIEVAQWLEDYAGAAETNLKKASGKDVAFRRLAIDVDLQIGLGKFFASKFRSGVLYAIHERTGDRAALEEALKAYKNARGIWAQIVERSKDVYVPNIAVGELAWLKGHWMDRLPAIDDDIAQMEQRLTAAKESDHPRVKTAITAALAHPKRPVSTVQHQAPVRFRSKEALTLTIRPGKPVTSAKLYYRHVNQAERYESVAMEAHGDDYRAAIPAAYTDTTYPLEYYFELKAGPENAWLHPGFAPNLANQPYFVVRRG